MSYRKSHIKGKIQRIKPKIPLYKKLWFWILLLVLIIIFSVFYLVIFYSGFQLKNIAMSGNQKISAQDLQQLVSEEAGTELVNFWGIKISSSSIFLINGGRISKIILQSFSVIEKVEINKNFPQTLALNIRERKQVGAYCQSDGRCFSIDQNGIVFEPLPEVPSDILIMRQTAGNGQAFVGQEVIMQSIAAAIYKIQKSLKDNFQINLKEALIASDIRLNITTNENWKIYFDLSGDSDINSQITKLDLLLNGQVSPGQRKQLRYIDLRPKDRAIICDNSTCGT